MKKSSPRKCENRDNNSYSMITTIAYPSNFYNKFGILYDISTPGKSLRIIASVSIIPQGIFISGKNITSHVKVFYCDSVCSRSSYCQCI